MRAPPLIVPLDTAGLVLDLAEQTTGDKTMTDTADTADTAADATMDRIRMDIAAALEFRAALMRRGNWSPAEMTMAGDRIAAAQSAAAAIVGRAR